MRKGSLRDGRDSLRGRCAERIAPGPPEADSLWFSKRVEVSTASPTDRSGTDWSSGCRLSEWPRLAGGKIRMPRFTGWPSVVQAPLLDLAQECVCRLLALRILGHHVEQTRPKIVGRPCVLA